MRREIYFVKDFMTPQLINNLQSIVYEIMVSDERKIERVLSLLLYYVFIDLLDHG